MDRDKLRYEVTLEEIRVINLTITNLDQKMNQIKTWCLTLWTGCWWLLVELTKHNEVDKTFAIFITMIPMTFAILDVEVKRNQLKFIHRARVLGKWLNAEKVEFEIKKDPGPNEIVATNFRYYDPSGYSGAQQKGNPDYKAFYSDEVSFTSAIRQSNSIKVFYGILVGLSIIGSGLFICFLGCPKC
ncbi:MAG: hypothetical protein ABJH72_14175 [Reichenbachiella sp.]|uniref:hypothetical protein n=1 Tax=Reichenbachiella sp. TaxID=2184521 RepID=UPI003299E844